MHESIRRVNGYDKDAYFYYPIVIIGAGESGIAMGCRLKQKLGFDQFRIFDRQGGIGGTWWINRYPGVACDIPALFYSFSFSPYHRWGTFYPSGSKIVQYLQDVCNLYQITDKIQLNTDVKECRWVEKEAVWEVTLVHLPPGTGDLSMSDKQRLIKEHGENSVYIGTEIIRAKIVVSAVGGLVEPRDWPEKIPGREKFQGDIFHSARWNYNVDMHGKNVVVIGTGCSAAQFVPKLTSEPYGAKSVTQLMRSPPWVVPRLDPPLGEEGWSKWSPTIMSIIPGLARTLRTILFLLTEYDLRLFGGEKYHANERKKMERRLIAHLKRSVPEKYQEMLTPDYSVTCKRRIFDATWFPALKDPKLELTTLPLTSVQEHSVTLGPGRTYPDPSRKDSKVPTEERTIPADVIVLANGFDTTKWIHPLKVVGKGGKDLLDTMNERGGAQAYQGTAMDGFPNFFMIFGPNTATGHSSVILASENMVNYSLKFIRLILNGDVSLVDVKQEAEMAYTRDMQEKLSKTVSMSGGCQNWYKTADGWNSTLFPYTQIYFTWRCMFPIWSDWNIHYTRKGIVKARLKQLAGVVGLCLLIAGMFIVRRNGGSVKGATDILRDGFRYSIGVLKQLLERASYIL